MIDESEFPGPIPRSISTRDVLQKSRTYLLQNYARTDVVFERGNGVYLFDNDGQRYLDCVSGLAVNALGHGDYDVLETIRAQSARLIHVSNLYHTIPAALLAEALVENSFADRVFFCNSGTEAIEASIKFARRWAGTAGIDGKHEIVSTWQSFHGRTMGSLSITGQEKYQAPFAPLVPGVRFATYNDVAETVAAITEKTAAVFLEPIQAEGGVHPATTEYMRAVRQACSDNGALLVFDEIQTGLGRTGTLFAYEQSGVEPDMMTLAKPLGGGLPIGAVLMRQMVADTIKPGDHAATFGGGPVACAVGLTILDKLTRRGIIANAARNGEAFGNRLREIAARHAIVHAVRGMGMIWGVELSEPALPFVDALRARQILACIAGPNVVRFLPPLVITEELLHQVADTFDEILTAKEMPSA